MMQQLTFTNPPPTQGWTPRESRFDGATYEPAHDSERLSSQLRRVFELMRDGQWRSLRDIAEAVGGSEAGVSARLRDMRKPRNGKHEVQRRRVAGGVFEYKLVVNPAGERFIA